MRVNSQLEKMKDDSLDVFIRRMAQFDHEFCRLIAGGNDFTIRLEIRGDKYKLVHARVYSDEIERPKNNT